MKHWPGLEEGIPELHRAIIDIASEGAGHRRRTEMLNSVRTLDDLHSAKTRIYTQPYHGTVYLTLIPNRSTCKEGKRHVRTVPVKLRRASNNLHKKHVDANFTFATKEYLKGIVNIFGSESVFALSVEDKAKVPVGSTAASKQAPLLMCMEYEERLPRLCYCSRT